MARHALGEISFELPEEWERGTADNPEIILSFTAPSRPGKASQPNVIFTRELLQAAQTLEGYFATQLAASARSLPNFRLATSRDCVFGRRPAVEYAFSWTENGTSVAQRQVVVAVQPMGFTLTASCTAAEMESMSPTFDAMLESIQFKMPAFHAAPAATASQAPRPLSDHTRTPR